jgi:hypothetical protein
MAAISTWNPEAKKMLGIGGRPCMNLHWLPTFASQDRLRSVQYRKLLTRLDEKRLASALLPPRLSGERDLNTAQASFAPNPRC